MRPRPDIVRYWLLVGGYRTRLLLKRAVAPAVARGRPRRLKYEPAVTVFISSMNTRGALELTIRSLMRNTSYSNYRIWVVDNASTDGSYEYLQSLEGNLLVTVTRSSCARPHGEWLDEVMSSMSTPYWVAVDSDMLFLGRDWLSDLISAMEADPEMYLLSSEQRRPVPGFIEPVSGETIDLGEAPATWLFCVRTSLRDRVQSSFLFCVDHVDQITGRKSCYDTGGKLLADMRNVHLRYAYMPRWYMWKYHHFGSMSWGGIADPRSVRSRFKSYQARDIRRRLRRGVV
jgi:hypothetical protein